MAKLIRNERYDVAHFFELNDQQLEVITHMGSNCVINAGAGTGKTKTLTAAYIDALLNMTFENGEPISPDNIVAITYTKSAAEELQSRIVAGLVKLGEEDVAEQMTDAWIMTIHAFCTKILKNEQLLVAREFGVDTNFSLIEGADEKVLQDEVVFSIVEEAYRDGEKEDSLKGNKLLFSVLDQNKLMRIITKIAAEARTFGVPEKNITAERISVTGLAFEDKVTDVNRQVVTLIHEYLKRYQAAKIAKGVLDFADLILYAKKLFTEHPSVKEKYMKKFGILLIDEFQDTNALQYEVFQNIATDNLVVVGDKRQSIYAFQGADVSVFDGVLKEVEEGAFSEVKLQRNYRSHKDVLDKVNEVFKSGELFDESYVPLLSNPDFVESHAVSATDEKRVLFCAYSHEGRGKTIEPYASAKIADEFKRLIAEEGYSPNDLVVIAPKKTDLVACSNELRAQGFNTHIIGGNKLLEDLYVQSLFDVLRAVDNPFDDEVLQKAAVSLMGNVADTDLARAAQFVRASRSEDGQSSLSLWEGFLLRAAEKSQSTISYFVQMVQNAAGMLATKPLADIARYVFSASGTAYYLQSKQASSADFDAKEQYANVLAFIDMIEQRQDKGMSNRTCLLSCKQDFEHNSKIDFGVIPESFTPGEQRDEAIRLMTIHKSKGLEFPVVAVYGYEYLKSDFKGCAYSIETNAFDKERSLRVCLDNYTLTTEEDELVTNLCKSSDMTKKGLGISSKRFTPRAVESFKYEAKQKEIEEGARKFYVAMTRAKERLIFVYGCDEPKNAATCSIDNIAMSAEYDEKMEIPGKNAEEKAIEKTESEISFQEQRLRVNETFTGAKLPELILKNSPDDFATWAANGASEQRGSATLNEITASGIEQYHSCPRQFYYSALLRIGLLSQTNAAMHRGTAMHTSLEQMANMILSGKSATEDIENMLEEILPTKIQNLYELSTPDVESVLKAVRSVITSDFWSDIMSCSKVRTEAQFYETLGQGAYIDVRNDGDAARETRGFYLHGYIDICGQRADGSWLALDYKSGTGEGKREKYETQAKCYALTLLRKGAPRVEIVFVRPEVADKKDATQCESFSFEYAASDISAIEDFLVEARSDMERAGLVENDELKVRVDKKACMMCSYRGPLCEGVSKM